MRFFSLCGGVVVLSPLLYMRVRGVCRLVTSGSRGSQGLDLAPIVRRGAIRLRSSGKHPAAALGCRAVSGAAWLAG